MPSPNQPGAADYDLDMSDEEEEEKFEIPQAPIIKPLSQPQPVDHGQFLANLR